MDHHVGDALLRRYRGDRLVSRVRTEGPGGPHRRRRVCLPGARHRQPPSGRGVCKAGDRRFCLSLHAGQPAPLCDRHPGDHPLSRDGGDSDELCAMPSRPLFVAKRQGRPSAPATTPPCGKREPAPPDAARSGGGHQAGPADHGLPAHLGQPQRPGRRWRPWCAGITPTGVRVSPADFIPLAEEGGAHPGLGALVLWQSCQGIWPDCSSPASWICRCPSTAPTPGVPDHRPGRPTSGSGWDPPPQAGWTRRTSSSGSPSPLLMETSDQHRGCGSMPCARRAASWPSTTSAPATRPQLSTHLPGGPGEDPPALRAPHPLQRAGQAAAGRHHQHSAQPRHAGGDRRVETWEQLNFLCQKGCAFTQGYLLSRPLPFDDLWSTCPQTVREPEPGESDHGELTPASAIMPASAP